MRSSPAFKVTIGHFGIWRAAVASITVLAALALAAWWSSGDASRSLPLTLAFAALSLGAVAGGASLLQCRPATLHWDAQCWHLERGPAAGPAIPRGSVAVALDLGAWMLLRFEHEGSRGRRITWLPVQRRGMEARWHALRCAVYCARSARGEDAETPSAKSPESQE